MTQYWNRSVALDVSATKTNSGIPYGGTQPSLLDKTVGASRDHNVDVLVHFEELVNGISTVNELYLNRNHAKKTSHFNDALPHQPFPSARWLHG